jgi:hypothetical protein
MQVDLSVTDITKSVKQVLLALRRRLTFDDNFQCQILEIADTGAAATPFLVVHKLGKVPIGYIANLDLHGTIRDVNRVGWTTTQMQLECSAANAKVYLIVF